MPYVPSAGLGGLTLPGAPTSDVERSALRYVSLYCAEDGNGRAVAVVLAPSARRGAALVTQASPGSHCGGLRGTCFCCAGQGLISPALFAQPGGGTRDLGPAALRRALAGAAAAAAAPGGGGSEAFGPECSGLEFSVHYAKAGPEGGAALAKVLEELLDLRRVAAPGCCAPLRALPRAALRSFGLGHRVHQNPAVCQR